MDLTAWKSSGTGKKTPNFQVISSTLFLDISRFSLDISIEFLYKYISIEYLYK